MRVVQIRVGDRSTLCCLVPETRRERMRGLRDHPLAPDEAMWLARASSVHTFGMRSPILVVRVDRGSRVAGVRLLGPGRVTAPSLRGLGGVLECHPDADVRTGDAVDGIGIRRGSRRGRRRR